MATELIPSPIPDPLPGEDRVERLSLVGLGAFGLLTLLLVCNVNGVVAMMTRVNQVFSVVILVLCLVVIISFRVHLRTVLGGAGVLFMAFFAYYLAVGGLISFISYSNSSASLEEIGKMLFSNAASPFIILAFASAAHYTDRRGQSEPLVRWLFIATCLSSLSVFLDLADPSWADLVQNRKDFGGRASGFFANPNELGIQAGFTMVFGAVLACLSSHVRWFVLAILIAFIAAFFSLSKTAILMALTLPLILGIFLQRARLNVGTLFGLGVAALLVGGLGFIIKERSSTATNFSGGYEHARRLNHLNEMLFHGRVDNEMVTGRFAQLEEGVHMWLNSPLFGNGFGSLARMPFSRLGPHNTLILILGESGLIGFGIFLAASLLAARAACSSRNPTWKILYVGSAIVMLSAMMSGHRWLTDRTNNAVLGVCLGLLSAERAKHLSLEET